MKRFSILFALFLVCFQAYSQDTIVRKVDDVKYVVFGEKKNSENTISSSAALEKYQKLKPSDNLSFTYTARVLDVCKAKGCWVKLRLGANQEAMVRFKDYGFFMPKDIAGREVIVSGLAFVEEMSVKEQQHYALDAGVSKEEIEKITSTKKTFGFTADGVLLKK